VRAPVLTSGVYPFFHTLPQKIGKKTHRCRKCKALVTKGDSGTSPLSRHLKRCDVGNYTEAMKDSPHILKLVKTEDGKISQTYSFKDALVHHINFVVWCLVSRAEFHISLHESFRVFCAAFFAPSTNNKNSWHTIGVMKDERKNAL
jgi:hypothetical protein